MKKSIVSIAIVVVFMVSCRASDEQFSPATNTEAPTAVPSETNTPTLSPSPTFTLTPTITPTSTVTPTETHLALSNQEMEEFLYAYRLVVVVQLNTDLLYDTLDQTQKGELDGFQQWALLLVMGALYEAADEAFVEFDPPKFYDTWWNDIIQIQNSDREIAAAWANQEIFADDAIKKVTPLHEEIEKIVIEIENALSHKYHIDSVELAKQRQEIIDSTEELFEDAGQ